MNPLICGLTIVELTSGPDLLGGDSGGPVYGNLPDGRVAARGLIVGGGRTEDGFAWAYTPIVKVLIALSADVVFSP